MANEDALTFIREAGFWKAEKYAWARPVIDSVLNETFDDNIIKKLVTSILGRSYTADGGPDSNKTCEDTTVEDVDDNASLVISLVTAIQSILNVGLVDLSAPLELKEGLSVIYGKNASGKSTVYLALCNTLGIPKILNANLNREDSHVFCQVSALDTNGKQRLLEWNGDSAIAVKGVRVFDTDVCTFLVEKDQVNEFELSHLKSEYFAFLNEAFDRLSTELAQYKTKLDTEHEATRNTLLQAFPEYTMHENRITKKGIEALYFSADESKSLTQISAEIEALSKQNVDAIVKNLDAAIIATECILNAVGKLTQQRNDDDSLLEKWFPSIGLDVSETNKLITNRIATKAVIEASGEAMLSELLPENWLSNPNWQTFIDASLSFVFSLQKVDIEKYSQETCPYCLQDLTIPEAKRLLKAYSELQDDNKKCLAEYDRKLEAIASSVRLFLERLSEIPAKLTIVMGELATVGIKEAFIYDLSSVQHYLEATLARLAKPEELKASDALITILKNFGVAILEFRKQFKQTAENLQHKCKNKEARVKELEGKAAPLKMRKKLDDNKKAILCCLNAKSKMNDITGRLEDLTALKQATSTLSTRFSKEVPLNMFKGYLQKEYEVLHYEPPQVWSLKTVTSGIDNKRVYSLRDKKIAEIFSEGERKIHALADFLAQCALNKFRGVYIFDDPVNSLDEERMECVRERLVKLVDEGNQVIVFTHNLFFLNLLVDTERQKVARLTKLESEILIEPEVILGTDNELAKRKNEIDKRMKELSMSEDLQKNEYYLSNVYDLISGYLESFVEIKIFCNVINRYRPNVRMHALDRLIGFNPNSIKEIMDLYKKTDRKGSRHSQPTGSSQPSYMELKLNYEIFTKKFSL